MIIDFKSFLESMQYSEGWLLCIFFKSQATGNSTEKPVPHNDSAILFEDFLFISNDLTFEEVIKKPTKLNLDWNFVALSMTEPSRSQEEIKGFLKHMREALIYGTPYYATFDKEGFSINPSKIE